MRCTHTFNKIYYNFIFNIKKLCDFHLLKKNLIEGNRLLLRYLKKLYTVLYPFPKAPNLLDIKWLNLKGTVVVQIIPHYHQSVAQLGR
jgi:hypothetical protein